MVNLRLSPGSKLLVLTLGMLAVEANFLVALLLWTMEFTPKVTAGACAGFSLALTLRFLDGRSRTLVFAAIVLAGASVSLAIGLPWLDVASFTIGGQICLAFTMRIRYAVASCFNNKLPFPLTLYTSRVVASGGKRKRKTKKVC